MTDINSCVLSGRLTRSPEAGKSDRGPTCKFSFANNLGYGDNEKTQFINVSVWGKRGETCLEYLTSGQSVTVIGSLFERKYQTKDGEDRTSLDMNANDVIFGAKPKGYDSPAPPPQSESNDPEKDNDDYPF